MYEWINKMLCVCIYIYIYIYICIYGILALKNGMLTHATMWMKFKDIFLSEISQSQKKKYCMILFI